MAKATVLAAEDYADEMPRTAFYDGRILVLRSGPMPARLRKMSRRRDRITVRQLSAGDDVAQQLTDDWNARFASGDHPWEEEHAWHGLGDWVERYLEPGQRVLDVGCGLGANARALAAWGLRVTAIDIAPHAIAHARALDAEGTVCWRALDFLRESLEGGFAAILDRGCLHSFCDDMGRAEFVARVADALEAGGLWMSVAGCSDERDDPVVVQELRLPRLSLETLARCAEPLFEVVEIRSCAYGSVAGLTDFRALAAVWRRRSNAR